ASGRQQHQERRRPSAFHGFSFLAAVRPSRALSRLVFLLEALFGPSRLSKLCSSDSNPSFASGKRAIRCEYAAWARSKRSSARRWSSSLPVSRPICLSLSQTAIRRRNAAWARACSASARAFEGFGAVESLPGSGFFCAELSFEPNQRENSPPEPLSC